MKSRISPSKKDEKFIELEIKDDHKIDCRNNLYDFVQLMRVGFIFIVYLSSFFSWFRKRFIFIEGAFLLHFYASKSSRSRLNMYL